MNKQKNKTYTKDPLYNWLVAEIQRVFSMLIDSFSFTLVGVEADMRGCWLTYECDDIKIQVWAEMGGRPEVDVVVKGVRRSLNSVIAERWPESALPPRPQYVDLENEQKDFTVVLNQYASALREFIATGSV